MRSLVLLRKTGRSEVDIDPDFVAFDIPDVFVVGYGLDFDGDFREGSLWSAVSGDESASEAISTILDPVDMKTLDVESDATETHGPWWTPLGTRTIQGPVRVQSFRGGVDPLYRQYIDLLTAYEDVEAQLAQEFVKRARFILTTRFSKTDITEDGYDFNGWILEFYQEQCNGIVQIDDQGFYSPKGDLIVDMAPQED